MKKIRLDHSSINRIMMFIINIDCLNVMSATKIRFSHAGSCLLNLRLPEGLSLAGPSVDMSQQHFDHFSDKIN